MWLVAIVVALVVLASGSWGLYDLIIARFYLTRPLEWVKAGRPVGMYHVPSGGRLIMGSFARNRLMMSLFVRTPGWIENDYYSKKLLLAYRIVGSGFFLGTLGLFVFIVIALLLS